MSARPERLDGARIWAQLASEAQAALGAAAVELAIARFGVEVAVSEREERVFLAAEEAATSAIDACAEAHIFGGGLVSDRDVPGVPSLLGPICRECGCTEHDACWPAPWPGGEGCAWAEPDLCTACADAQVRPRTAPAPGGAT